MLVDGEKWACEACVRGHRVSSCRHHDRPLIRINKKGRPFSVCIICRGPCNHREEHSKLNRDKKSDGESDSKSSKKPSTRRRIPPSSFARIAPHPAPLPSSSEPETTSQARSHSRNSPSNRKRSSPPLPRTSSSPVIPMTATINTSTAAAAATVTETPIDTIATSNGYIPVISSAPVTPPLDPALLSSTNNGFPSYLDPIGPLDNSVSHLNFPYVTLPMMAESLLPTSSSPSNHTFLNDVMFAADHGYVPESMYTGFEDMDTLPEDWSTFFWNEPS